MAEDESPTAVESTTLFPVYNQKPNSTLPVSNSNSNWLCNTSFTADLSTINNLPVSQPEFEQETKAPQVDEQIRFELVNSSSSESEKRKRRKKMTKKKRKKSDYEYGPSSSFRKQNTKSWSTNANANTNKEYYFDSRGDRDNLAFGSLYRSI